MVRFIIYWEHGHVDAQLSIYIPIWLDLLSLYFKRKFKANINLHSNMVRFIMKLMYIKTNTIYGFTFQYG